MALLHYQQLGQGDHIILIHGLFGSLENLNMVAKHLAENYCVLSVDVRNHGLSFHENEMGFAVLAHDILDLMDALNIEKAHLLGHSMGGKIAMEFAMTNPERTNKLIIADIAPVTYPAHHQRIIDGLKALDFSTIKRRSDADEQLSHFVESKGVRQFLLRNIKQENDTFSLKCNIHFIAQNYSKLMLGNENNPPFLGETLFIKGGNSNYLLAEHQTLIKKLLPASQLKIIANTGHWLHAEKPHIFNKLVTNFLQS